MSEDLMLHDTKGEWVRYADYEKAISALREKLTEVERSEAAWGEIRKANATLNNDNGALRVRAEASEAKLAAVEGERDELRVRYLQVSSRNVELTHQAEARVTAAEAREAKIKAKAERVCWFDWSENDPDAVAAIEALRAALTKEPGEWRSFQNW